MKGLWGTIHVTFEEGTQAAWLCEIVKPVAVKVIVCNPRMNKLLMVGKKADRVDAHKLAELLRCGQLKPVYHGAPGVRLLKATTCASMFLTGLIGCRISTGACVSGKKMSISC
jgi:hypothetical protein